MRPYLKVRPGSRVNLETCLTSIANGFEVHLIGGDFILAPPNSLKSYPSQTRPNQVYYLSATDFLKHFYLSEMLQFNAKHPLKRDFLESERGGESDDEEAVEGGELDLHEELLLNRQHPHSEKYVNFLFKHYSGVIKNELKKLGNITNFGGAIMQEVG